MNPATLLRQTFDAYRVAKDAWFQNQFNLELIEQERQEYYDSYMTAEMNLNHSMQLIRQNELLVLTSITEARVFRALLPQFLANRGNLNRVQVRNMSDGNRADVRCWLESRGFTLEQTNPVFLFPEK
ncbi:hypothetical protein BT93_A1617 [Corymbia citriodora subsp. variegata]|nr:hypothetical protein BT93_A1617 [Corymbia citriodora subsp. variegata]